MAEFKWHLMDGDTPEEGEVTEEQKPNRIHEILYSCDSRKELAERIVALEELVVQAHKCKTNDGCCEDCYQDNGCCPIERDMEELGIEVK